MNDSVSKICEKAIDGDMKALDWLISAFVKPEKTDDTSDTSKKLIYYSGIPAHLISKDFNDIYRDIRERKHRFYNFKGGRGSLKSSFCALVIIDEIMRNKNFCAIALRQVKDTLRTSVYAQLIWAIDMLELTDLFEFNLAPLQIKKKDTGQLIYFRGCDNPVNMKSIRTPKGTHIGAVWFEEKDQFNGSEAVRSILQSVMRGDDDIIVLSSYNTPKNRRHFLNQEELVQDEKTIFHHSYYYNAPREWLGQPFFDEAEYLEKTNPKAYEHEYLGVAVGETGNVFENVKVRDITDAEIKTFGALYYGLDFGWIDPFAFNSVCYDPNRLTLYIFEELHGQKTANRDLAKLLKRWEDCDIMADSANPKDIADLREFGIRVRGAMKGQGSVQMGIKWLQSLKEIVIDPHRCPHTAEEFTTYEYEKDSSGEVISSYPDKNNHHVDAVRYSMSNVIRRYAQ